MNTKEERPTVIASCEVCGGVIYSDEPNVSLGVRTFFHEPCSNLIPEDIPKPKKYIEPVLNEKEEKDRIKKLSKHNDPFTSKEAAEGQKKKLGKDKLYVLELFEKYGQNGLTDAELESHSELYPGNAQKRRSDLSNAGRLVWRGETRPSPAKRQMKVWWLP